MKFTWSRSLRLLTLTVVALQICIVVVMYELELQPAISIYHTNNDININYINFDTVNKKQVFKFKADNIERYFLSIGDQDCFKDGILVQEARTQGRCVCKDGYYGSDCGVPADIFKAYNGSTQKFTQRERPRRLISAVPVNHEFDLFQARVNMHYDIVDVFLTQESNFSNSGDAKSLLFLEKFSRGWLNHFQDKILYILRSEPPEEGFKEGAIADAHMRRTLSREGLKLLTDVRLDDLFIYNDGDEIIKPEVLVFLKLYDGIPHLVSIKYIWAIFGFFWRIQEDFFPDHKSFDPAILSVQFFRDFYDYDASHVRSDDYKKHTGVMAKYERRGEDIGPLLVEYAGWHCSWCFSPQGIRRKLLDAPLSDYPRYGDYRGKTEIKYIRRLIKHGIYFDLAKFRNGSEVTESDDPMYAPPYILNNKDQFSYLLTNPYTNISSV